MFLKIGMAALVVLVVLIVAVALWMAGHGMETRDQWQQGDEE